MKLCKQNDFPIARIQVDPSRFQYKQGYNVEDGAGLSLTGAKLYDPGLAGRLTLYHVIETDTYYVVNGHQRLALAKRHGVTEADVQILESTDYSESEARAYGAVINVAEGRGTAMDAAIFMRETGTGPEELSNRGVDLADMVASNASALYNLSEPLFRAVRMMTLAEHTAIVIGRELPDDPDGQAKILASVREIRGIDPNGVNIANFHKDMMLADSKLVELIRLAKGAGVVEQTQVDLFGTHAIKTNLMIEQAEVLSFVRDCLRKDRRLFSTVVGNKGRLEAGRTRVDAKAATTISDGAAARIDLLDRVAYSRGTETNRIVRYYAEMLLESPKAKNDTLHAAYAAIFQALGADYKRNFGTELKEVA